MAAISRCALRFLSFPVQSKMRVRLCLLPSVCTRHAYRHALGVFPADCLWPIEPRQSDRSGGGGCHLNMHPSALILIIGPERDVASPHNYLHTVNLSLGGRAKPNPQRPEAISRMRRGRWQLRCRLMYMKELLCGLNCTSSLFGILGFICIYFIKAVGGMGNSPTLKFL